MTAPEVRVDGVVLACDLGGSSLRAALIDAEGRTRVAHRVAMPAPVERDGRSEADPALWWRGFVDALEALAQAEPALIAGIAAIAVNAMTRSQVFVGEAGQVLRPALLWRDTRSGETLETLRALCPPGHPETAGLNAFHPLARLWWLRQAEPDAFAALRHVLDPKDYLNLLLTGVATSDPVSLARLAAAAAPDAEGRSLLGAAGLPSTLLPPLRPPLAMMGRVRAGHEGVLAGLAGIPVVTGANDTWASVVGLGAMRAGCGYNLTGTTEVFGIVTGKAAQAEGLMTVDWGEGLSQLGGPSQCGGDTLIWLLDLLGCRDAAAGAALEALLDGPRDADPLLFLPYLQGERVPFWDPSLRGAFVGLNRRHGPGDLAWAVLEGVAFLNRIVLERAEAAAGERIAEIRYGGGGASSRHWPQVKADILGRSVVLTQSQEHGLLGAAIAAWTALGRFPDLAAAQAALVQVGRRCEPDPHRHARYQRLTPLFVSAGEALAPIGRALAASGRA